MSNYFIGNDNFYFLLNEVSSLSIESVEHPWGAVEIEEGSIVIVEALEVIEKLLEIEDKLLGVIIYTDEIKTIHLKLIKKFNIRVVLKEKEEYVYCDNHIEGLESRFYFGEESVVIVSDISEEAVVKLGEISYFSYDRITKKSFAKHGIESFFLRKNLGELEELLPEDLFFRLDRSYIINIKQVKGINFKEEFLIFKSDEKIYINRGKLKSLSKKLSKKYSIL